VTRYLSTPAVRCHLPGKSFQDREEALRYAAEATRWFHVGFACWQLRGGRVRLVKRFRAVPKAG
jgi:hypothetical protein